MIHHSVGKHKLISIYLLLISGGCVSRILGPIAVGSIYTRYGTTWTFGITCIMMILPMIWLYILRNRLDIGTKELKDVEMTAIKHCRNNSNSNGPIRDVSVIVNEIDSNNEHASFLSKTKGENEN